MTLSRTPWTSVWFTVVLVLAVLGSSTESRADGFRLLPQSASAFGQGNAFAAQADDPSAIHYNPAGMTQLSGVHVMLGTTLVGGGNSFTNSAGASAQGDLGGSVAMPPPSNIYVTANLKALGVSALRNVTVGVGVTSPFGLRIRWPNDGPFSTAVTSASLPLLDIKPTLAYKINDQLSVGIGADIYTFASFLGDGHAEIKFNNPGIPGIPLGTPLELNGKDTAAGFNVSLLYTPFRNDAGQPLMNIGLVYRTQATLHLNGEFLANGARIADSSFTAVLPQVFTGGVAIWPVRNLVHEWKLELDADFIGWQSFRNLDTHLSNGSALPIPQNWHNAYTIGIGTEYRRLQLTHLPAWEMAVRGGYIHSQTPVPDSTFNPFVPDSDYNAVTAGLGFLCKGNGKFLGLLNCNGLGMGNVRTKAIGLDLAYSAVLYEPRTVAGNQNPTVDGTYKTTLHFGLINIRASF